MIAHTIAHHQMPPLHQKRIVAFVNHFLISSISFLNAFASKCESKFIELERKLQKIEAAMTIIEEKLASIPPDSDTKFEKALKSAVPVQAIIIEQSEIDNLQTVEDHSEDNTKETNSSGVRACDDLRYKKFFKMVQFGVPAEAVKLKMRAEGLNSTILDTPNLMLNDHASFPD